MREFTRGLAAFLFVFILFCGIAWLAGFPDWPDPFTYDHPENFTRAQ